MSDFFDDLERHLDRAAHRQARWGRLASVPRPPAAAAVPVVCVAAVLAIGLPQLGDREVERGRPGSAPAACDPSSPPASATPEPARPTDGAGGGPTPEPACADSSAADGERGERVPDGRTSYAPVPDEQGCTVPKALAAAVPELNRAPGPPPDLLETGGDGPVGLGSARLAIEVEGTEYWVHASLACERPGADADRACVTPVRPEYEEASGLCATLAELDEGVQFMSFRAGGGVAVAGFAPEGAREVDVLHDGRVLTTLVVESRVFAGVVPITVRRQEGELEVRATPASPG